MPPNVHHWERRRDEHGRPVNVPIPFTCMVCRREPANYGLCGVWYCTFCWQERT